MPMMIMWSSYDRIWFSGLDKQELNLNDDHEDSNGKDLRKVGRKRQNMIAHVNDDEALNINHE
jgi:hypothetical protein